MRAVTERKMIKIVVANEKGGVGKTTTAINLGFGMADMGWPVVLVDCDPQSDIATFLDLEDADGFFDLVIRQVDPEKLVAHPLPGGSMQCIISGPRTTDVETLLRNSANMNPLTALRDPLKSFRSANGRPAIVIIDTAPSLSAIQLAALAAADWLIIPAKPEFGSEAGIARLTQTVTDLQAKGAQVKLLGILPTLVDRKTKEHKETINRLAKAFPGLVFWPVSQRIAIGEAPRAGKSIFEYAPEAAMDYSRFLAQVIKRVGL